ncbi:putative zinc-binding alcohol dehydrogenase domain-containing protein cipB [Aspergillus steynii IBT 23096]|uniref:Putative zinc-binding alcohol dehydrogenase domain-containing protein cipB n=1 Tax=Aspergillus steynii IBT 23096 TaxID=1392250 RepID=A0A2I2FV25_9EURO|nr:putative zinc-binding alcohol dehydrogenase domain-containing protein cipB [Aspergillus steynii IBT 23096]PLB44472.1 putative zinc-binding alcohol dehydrogenase domain-containing protein cipB [Aspergillus steynii IBT 23096]
MAAPANQAAWIVKAGAPLEVGDAPLPTAGPGEIVVKNAAAAINPLDCHMQDSGVFVQQFPAILGCDVAGEVYEVGADVQRFKKGDRVIGHTINLVTGRPQDGAFAHYSVVSVDKAAILPDNIPFTDGVVVPFALEAAVCALCLQEPGVAMPGVSTPALGLPYPSLKDTDTALPPGKKTLIIYGGSSSVGSMATQFATAMGIHVIAISGAHNFVFSQRCGAIEVLDHKDTAVVEKAVQAVRRLGESEFIGIFDAIATPETYAHDRVILERLGGGHLACVHPPPAMADLPVNVKAGMIFAVNDVAAPVWRDFVTPALRTGRLQCLPPPVVVGKGLGCVQDGLYLSKAGVSARKLVVEF